jgi:hypothetical protein
MRILKNIRPSSFVLRRFTFKYWLLALAVTLVGAQPVQAQSGSTPFETLELRFSGARNLNRNFLHAFWQQGTGGEFSIETPFYLGYAEVGGAYHRYPVNEATVPAFDAVLVYAGWGLGVGVADRLRLEGGARIGNYRMSFDEATLFPGVKNESELALMLNARLAIRLVGPMSLRVGGSYMKVYTFLRLNLWYASAGLSYRLNSPNWLKEFLR